MLPLPPDVLQEIALRLPIPALSAYCRGNKQLQRLVCNNDQFWLKRIQQDYSSAPILQFNETSYKAWYMRVHQAVKDQRTDLGEYIAKHNLDVLLQYMVRTGTFLHQHGKASILRLVSECTAVNMTKLMTTKYPHLLDPFMSSMNDMQRIQWLHDIPWYTYTVAYYQTYQYLWDIYLKNIQHDTETLNKFNLRRQRLEVLYLDDVSKYTADMRGSLTNIIANDALNILIPQIVNPRVVWMIIDRMYNLGATRIIAYMEEHHPFGYEQFVEYIWDDDGDNYMFDAATWSHILIQEFMDGIFTLPVNDNVVRFLTVIYPYWAGHLDTNKLLAMLQVLRGRDTDVRGEEALNLFQVVLPPLTKPDARLVDIMYSNYHLNDVTTYSGFYWEYYRYHYLHKTAAPPPFCYVSALQARNNPWLKSINPVVIQAIEYYLIVLEHDGQYHVVAPGATWVNNKRTVVTYINLGIGVDGAEYVRERFGM